MIVVANFNTSTATAVFKTKYVKLSRDMFNSSNVVLAKIKQNSAAVGEDLVISVPTSFGGGVGTGVLPRGNPASYVRMRMTRKKAYAVVEVDREAIKAADSDEGAFVRATKEQVKRGVQSFQRNSSRILFNDSIVANGNGRLGSFSGNQTLVSADVFDVVITTASWKLANFEPKDYVQVNTTSTLFEVTAVTASTRTVRLTRIDGPTLDLSAIGAGTHNIFMQGSRDNDPTGLRGVINATTGSIYGVTVGYRWQGSFQFAAGGAALSPDILNDGIMSIKYLFGETVDMLVTSFVQYRRLLNALEDQKRYMIVESRNSGPRGKFSFQALEYMADTGPIPVIAERFVEDDTLYFLNSDFIEMHQAPDGGWVDDDGTIFLRSGQTDTFQARYAVYYENGIHPTPHGITTGLATS